MDGATNSMGGGEGEGQCAATSPSICEALTTSFPLEFTFTKCLGYSHSAGDGNKCVQSQCWCLVFEDVFYVMSAPCLIPFYMCLSKVASRLKTVKLFPYMTGHLDTGLCMEATDGVACVNFQ